MYDSVHKNKFDTQIAFLLDRSGSTSGLIGIMQKLELEKICAGIVWHGLQGYSGFRTPIYFFNSSENTTNITEVESPSAFSEVQSGGANNDASAVRYVTQQIANDPARKNMLLLFADGSPTRACTEDPVTDLSHAIREASDQGIAVHYFLIRPGGKKGSSDQERKSYQKIAQHAFGSYALTHPTHIVKSVKELIEREI